MLYLPIHFCLENKKLLFVGGGRVNERRIKRLVDAPCRIILVSPDATKLLSQLSEVGRIEWRRRRFVPEDLEGVDLVFVAISGDPAPIVGEAKKRGIPVECASNASIGDFIVPAVIRKGNILVSISTSGTDPAFCACLKSKIEKLLDETL